MPGERPGGRHLPAGDATGDAGGAGRSGPVGEDAEQWWLALFGAAPDAMFVVDSAGRIRVANRRAAELTGYPAAALVGRPVEILLPLARRTEHAVRRVAYVRSPRARTMGAGLDLRLRRRDGVEVPVDVSLAPLRITDRTYVIADVRDVTGQRDAAAALERAALHDPLTGLPNRTLLMDRLAQSVGELARQGGLVAVFYVDLDRFKHVNDAYGHDTGDAVLREIARRLDTLVRPGDTAARLGGDEFVLVVGDLRNDHDVLTVTRRIRSGLDRPVPIGEQSLEVTASIGVAVAREATLAPADLLRGADVAMYEAKRRGPGRVEQFDETLARAAVEQREVELLLEHALHHDGLRLAYQPVYDVVADTVAGFEALIRIERPGRAPLEAHEFISAAEDSGLIVPIDGWVVNEACAQLAAWQEGPGPTPHVAVNLSAKQIARGDVDELVLGALADHAADAAHLTVELTERDLLAATPSVTGALVRLRSAGVSIALDDFGTGFSGFRYLQQFPVDILKVDRSFVADLATRSGTAIVEAITTLGRSLDLTVIAEGVETADQLRRLRALGCRLAQGFLFAPARFAGDATALLGRPPAPARGPTEPAGPPRSASPPPEPQPR